MLFRFHLTLVFFFVCAKKKQIDREFCKKFKHPGAASYIALNTRKPPTRRWRGTRKNEPVIPYIPHPKFSTTTPVI